MHHEQPISGVEALISGHPRVAKMVPITWACRLRECKNTEFVWELRKTGFCEGSLKYSCFPLTCTDCIHKSSLRKKVPSAPFVFLPFQF